MHRIFLFCCIIITACNSRTSTPAINVFTGDSGYLTKREVLPFAVANDLFDSATLSQIKLDIADTTIMAKYYAMEKFGHYLVCMDNVHHPGVPFYLFEVMPNGTIRNKQAYHHQNYCNCWDERIGLGRLDDYYYVRICGTGSNFKASKLYVFKKLLPQESLHAIPEYAEEGIPDAAPYTRYVRGKFEVEHDLDEIIGTYEVVRKTPDTYFALREDSFEIYYQQKGEDWIATDTTAIMKYWMFY